MDVTDIARLGRRVREELGRALVGHGLTPIPSDNPEWAGWYVVENSGIPDVVAGVATSVMRHRYGGIGLSGFASIRSMKANDILREMPRDAWLEYDKDSGIQFRHIDSVYFGDLRGRSYPALSKLVGSEEYIGEAVEWFMDFVTDPVRDWFAARNSLEQLIELARVPSQELGSIVNPGRFRGVVGTCVSVGRFHDAASLMRWYIERDIFNRLDSSDRARALDEALAHRFAGYHLARESLQK